MLVMFAADGAATAPKRIRPDAGSLFHFGPSREMISRTWFVIRIRHSGLIRESDFGFLSTFQNSPSRLSSGIVPGVFLPLLLIVVAGLSGSAVAYGTYPIWMQYPHGLEIILWSRRLQWPLVSLSLIACILLIGLAISGCRRAWWLIGLAPVLALFAHRFTLGPDAGRLSVVENPAWVSADRAVIGDNDWVVGFAFGDVYFAYPYSALFNTPVIIQSDHEKRLMLIWSAYANRALAVLIDQELKGRDLEIVSTPANALLLYNSRRGQFINGLTGKTTRNEKPAGFAAGPAISTTKMRWKAWLVLHPETQVLALTAARASNAPTQPIQPVWPMPPMKLDRSGDTRVALIGIDQPVAVESSLLTASPLNTKADDIPVALFRDKAELPMRAFDRRILDHQGNLDLIVELAPNLNHRRHPLALFVDLGSNSGWNATGVCEDAPADAKYLKGKRLTPVAVDDDLPWSVMKYWYPQVKLEISPAAPIAVEAEGNDTMTTDVVRRHARRPRTGQ